MIDATGRPRRVLLIGGTSDIGLAVVERLLKGRTGDVVLAGRDPEGLRRATERLAAAGHDVTVTVFDATEVSSHGPALDGVLGQSIDVVVLAIGVLVDQAALLSDPSIAAAVLDVNFVAAGALAIRMAGRLREQGYGQMIVLSSVAADRQRRSNFIYGASKSGLDALACGLAEDLRGSGAGITVVRSGFVHSRMTEGIRPAPFATTPGKVADVAAEAVRTGRTVVYAPRGLRFVMALLRRLPSAIFRRLPA